ncbi:MAG: Ig-like domain-containing protein [Acidobacteria bacterium]|nr:Ig-like domain-containing protein [Acidobacteriota bacterium]
MTRHSLLFALIFVAAILCGCGGKNGLVGGDRGNSVYLTSITLAPLNPTITLAVAPQQPAMLKFAVTGTYNVGNPQDISDQVTWISADAKVATVDPHGTATATGSGRVIVTAQIFVAPTQKTLQATTILTVVPQLTSITVSPTVAQIAKDTTQQFAATGNYNDGTQADVTALVAWNSSQPAATISSSLGTRGRATGVAPGVTNITAALGSLASAPASLTVTNANLVSLAITPSTSTVPLAASQQFVATGSFDDGTKQDISATATWNSSEPTIARTNSEGLVTGLGLGSTNVSAGMNGVSATVPASVDASSILKVNVVPTTKIASNTGLQMRAFAVFKNGSSLEATTTPGVTWTSSDPSVATIVPGNGRLSAVRAGSASISAKLGSQNGSSTLSVSDATIQSLVVAPNLATIAPGTTQNVIALATFADNAGPFQQDISSVAAWSSDNTGVATVSYAGGLQELARSITTGTANISASFSDAHGTVSSSAAVLNVSTATLTGISLSPGNVSVTLNGGHQLIASGVFSDGTQQDLTLTADWNATEPSIATVTPFGFAGASGRGQTNITASLGSQSGSSSLLVNPGTLSRIDICPADTVDPLNNCPPLDPIGTPPPISFPKSFPYSLIAIGTFTDGSRVDLTSSVRWTTSDSSTATISNDPGIPGYITGITATGVATGLVSGRVTIIATADAISGTSEVFVTDATPVFLTVTPANGATNLGLTQQLAVSATFSDNTSVFVTPYVYWTTSDPSVVVVRLGGLAYPVGRGTATVTANIGGAASSTTLTVQ